MPSPAENHVLKFSREPTMTEEPADRIINPIMVLNVPLMRSGVISPWYMQAFLSSIF